MPEQRAKSYHRGRVTSTFTEEITAMLEGELSDPRIAPCHVTEVVLAPGGKSCRVFIAVTGNEQEEKDTLEGLMTARGFIRTEIIRYARNCSERLDFLRICRAFSSRLRERGFHPTFLRNVFATVEHGYHPPKGKRATPVVFKIPYGGGPEISALSGVIKEWYDACPLAFRAHVPKPIVCYTMGKNVYGMLVRAKVHT